MEVATISIIVIKTGMIRTETKSLILMLMILQVSVLKQQHFPLKQVVAMSIILIGMLVQERGQPVVEKLRCIMAIG